MKSKKHGIGTNEARIALSIVTLLLVAFGYFALRFLGGSAETPPVEIRGVDSNPADGRAAGLSDGKGEVLPQVLPAQDSNGPDVPLMSQRPVWEPRPLDEIGDDFDLGGGTSLWPDRSELPVDYDSETVLGQPR